MPMAENETLDLHHSTRWLRVLQSLDRGCSIDQVKDEIMAALAKSWRAVDHQFRKAGFTREQVTEAALNGDHAFLDMAYRASKHHRFVRLIEESAPLTGGEVAVMVKVVANQLHTVADQARAYLTDKGRDPAAADRMVSQAFGAADSEAERFARGLVEPPRRTAAGRSGTVNPGAAGSVDPKVFGERLAKYRRAAGKTQEDVAVAMGMSRPTYIAVEKGARAASAGEVMRLAELLGRTVHDLVRPDLPVKIEAHLRVGIDASAKDADEVAAGFRLLEDFAEDYLRL
jgi:transcriptional regulator with XRE-family HTH domain